eukprot:9339911-Pyramimonas_sp.AAC.1
MTGREECASEKKQREREAAAAVVVRGMIRGAGTGFQCRLVGNGAETRMAFFNEKDEEAASLGEGHTRRRVTDKE